MRQIVTEAEGALANNVRTPPGHSSSLLGAKRLWFAVWHADASWHDQLTCPQTGVEVRGARF